LENLIRDLIERSIERTKKTLGEAKLQKNEIDEIVLVGGTTLIPAVREAVKNLFGKEPNVSINPEEVVALGASIEAEIIKGGKAAEGEIKSVLLLDVLPLSLGIETLGGVNTIMIQKNTTIPTAKTQIFSTAADNQPSVEINVLQGERSMANDNRSIGRFILDGVPPAPRGLPQIEVTFDVSAEGIIDVTAKDKATGRSQKIRIEGSVGLSKEEIEKMKKEAELHVAEDQKKRDLIESKNLADSLIYTTEKTIKEAGDKISVDTKKEIEEKINNLKKVKDSDNIEDIKNKTSDLSQVIQKIGAELYKQNQGQQKPEEGGSQPEEGQYKEK
jgi:molecular chaperone DnaK